MLSSFQAAFHQVVRRPAFLVAASLTLALGFSANSLMVSIINAVFWADLPYHDAARLVHVSGGSTDGRFGVSEMELQRYEAEMSSFASVGAYVDGSVNIRVGAGTEKLPATRMTRALLETLGTSPLIGRGFSAEEAVDGGPNAALLSHGYWRSAFNADPGVIGKPQSIDGRPVTVIGVLPADFRLPTHFGGRAPHVYLPLRIGEPDPRNIHYLEAIARLRSEAGFDAAAEEARLLAARLRGDIQALPEAFRIIMTPVRTLIVGDVQSTLFLLHGMVTLLLLVACANVTCLALVRTSGRMRDLSIRNALGATFSRLSALVAMELLIVFAAGGTLGLLLANLGLRVIHLLPIGSLPMVAEPSIDVAVIGYMFLAILLTTLGSVAVSVLRLRRLNPVTLLYGGGRNVTGGGAHGSQRMLVAGQMALTFVLAVAAALMVKSLWQINSVDPGYRPDGVLTMELSLPRTGYPDKGSVRAFYDELLGSVRTIPGVIEAGATTQLPVADRLGDWGIRLEGREAETLPSGRRPWADYMIVSSGFLESMRTTLLAGRTFTRGDVPQSQPVALINEAMARAYWPDESALGQRFLMSTDIDGVYRRVVGIVADTRHAGPDAEVRPQVYLPLSQFPAAADIPVGTVSLVVRTEAGLSVIQDEVISMITSIDPDVAASRVRTMNAWLADANSLRRLSLLLSGAFAALALALMAVGVYGLISMLTAERTREISVRIALGADRSRIHSNMILPTVLLAMSGLAAGLVALAVASDWLAGQLFRVSPLDPIVLFTVAAGLLLVATAASWLPARRATRIDPMRALREE